MADTYLGASATGWSARTAVGTFALAGATFLAIVVGVRQRNADRADLAAQLLADQQERRDDDARQVSAEIARSPATIAGTVTVTAPINYELKQLAVQLVSGSGEVNPMPDRPVVGVREGRMTWIYLGDSYSPDDAPIISFNDRHGDLYFQYDQRTERFPAGTDAAPRSARSANG